MPNVIAVKRLLTNVLSGIDPGYTLPSTTNITVAATKTLAVTTADKLTVGGNIIPQELAVSVSIGLHATKTLYNLMIARFALQVTSIDYCPDIAQGGTLTGTVVKATSTTAPASATTPMHIAAAINLNGTAHTVQPITLTVTAADLVLAAGDRIGFVESAAMTTGSGVITIKYKRV